MKTAIWLAWLQLLCIFSSALSIISGNETDKLALLGFKSDIDRDPLGILSSWNGSAEHCTWVGVKCESRRVVALELPVQRLEGRLSPYLGNLSFLRVLNLANNGFGPEIPPELGRLFNLQVLNFRNNSFSSEIPANISGWSRLQYLGLQFNTLGGAIPADIGSLSELRTLQFSGNRLTGEIPASVGNLSMLTQLYLADNRFQGSIPTSLSRLKSVRIFSVAMNNLTGTVPLGIYNLSRVEVFGIHANRLEGTMPSDLGLTLPNLQYFSIVDNRFFGLIPITLSNASNLIVFQIQRNNFTGKIPSFKSSLNLTRFGVSFNNLGSGRNGDFDFINDLVNCSMLESLGVAENNLGGEIPESIGNFTSMRLRELVFGRNKISGKIPSGIGNLVSIQALGFEDNQITGPIPNSIGNLRGMIAMTLHENRISGSIPSSIGNLTSLIRFSSGRNSINGSIPSSLGECRNLQVLSLRQNHLSGPIPPQLVSLSSLTQYLDLSRNQLTGSIPVEVRRLVSLGGLDMSENKLSGEIPKALGSCKSLEYLYLQGNYLRGSIPDELDTLRGLRLVDFSRNNLTGQVPEYFADFRGLVHLNLSFNELEGQVPVNGIYENSSKFSVTGNVRLCGGLQELELPLCESDKANKNKLSTRAKIYIIVASLIGGLGVLTFFVVFIFYRSRKGKENIVEPLIGISLPRVSYVELSKATNGFSQENLLGSGGFGSVYKGVLVDQERLVAVKVLNLHVSRALKSFIAECESLGTIRHRNLVKILTICSSIDSQGNDFKALVYEFMENGNLEEWLHSVQTGQEQSRPSLSLIERIDIAIDVASALDYLHNYSSESIAHCDIKPSNILLDSLMVARIGDFGLAKLLKSTFLDQSSSAGVRGTIGYVAPEYAEGSDVSTLGDIYSYGILLLEMFTGKRPTDSMFKDDFDLNNFASMALPDQISKIVDPILVHNEVDEEDEERSENGILGCDDQDQIVLKCLAAIVEIGVVCSSKFLGDRRNMSDVANELRRIREIFVKSRAARNHFDKTCGAEGL